METSPSKLTHRKPPTLSIPGTASTTTAPPPPASNPPPEAPEPALTNGLKSPWIQNRLKTLAKAYNERGEYVKKAISDMSDESDKESEDEESRMDGDPKENTQKQEENYIAAMFGDEWKPILEICDLQKQILSLRPLLKNCSINEWFSIHHQIFNLQMLRQWRTVYEPQSAAYITWLFVISLAFLYNAFIVFFRIVFDYERISGNPIFHYLDFLADVIYLMDMFWFKPRLKFIDKGQWISDFKLTRKNYRESVQLRRDVLAIFPIDYIVAVIHNGSFNSYFILQRLLRLNRFVKISAYWELYQRIDSTSTSFPHLFRILRILMYKIYIIHLTACTYYISSAYEGFGATPWTYDGEGNAYLRCFYFAFRTTTSIGGRLPKPTTPFERVYMMFAWLLGVFIFAMVIGQIRDIVANASRSQSYYRDVLNMTSNYMRQLIVPPNVQKRVRFWLNFTWQLQKTFNENDILKSLPLKMRTDIALSVHVDTLSKVELFRNIDRSVLRDIVLKLKPMLYLPGDYVCRKGDVGHEMYIVSKGCIHVLGPEGQVLINLGEGSVFGEIAILNLEGFTRRTADVRSVGYSQLFALRKGELWETLKIYPEYQDLLKKKVQRILRKKQREARRQTKEAKAMELRKQQENNRAKKEEGSTGAQVTINCESEEDFEAREIFAPLDVESIVKDRPRTPRLFDAVMGAVRPDSKIRHYYSRSQSLCSYNREVSFDNSEQERFECKIKLEDDESSIL